jgi:hypothetical protein
VHDIALGYVDIGVGLFAQTHKRYQLALYTPPVYPTQMYLATFFDKVADKGSIGMMFKPFHRDLWISLGVAIFVVSLLIMLFEGQDKFKETGKLFRKSVFLNVIK